MATKLLADIKRVFEEAGKERLRSLEMVNALAGELDSPWGNWYGRVISPQAVAKILQPFGIRTRQLWIDGKKERGWERSQFEDAWLRYLPGQPVEPVDAVGAPSEKPTQQLPGDRPTGRQPHPGSEEPARNRGSTGSTGSTAPLEGPQQLSLDEADAILARHPEGAPMREWPIAERLKIAQEIREAETSRSRAAVDDAIDGV